MKRDIKQSTSIVQGKFNYKRAVVVAQLAEQSILRLNVRSSNPVIGEKIILNTFPSNVEKTKKRTVMANFKK